ncbi:SpoIIE family protein phosphatase [Streptomyces sp. QHH-9511]|uniref:PP2C family protein-serine/threonine phosphatase n=1 Tax=Streptomyces sp. QHH-9511 TaxID=2684468 RepID=UPI0013199923|nr:PP2C family protein-serine/threonine phosphatase [Streptomyces sp. QHH-9511]QGZ47473.1 SpoIIE family protein phosphatase [Streptomyces sp. QHH-9511]
MNLPLPDDVTELKAVIGREISALRADVRRKAGTRQPKSTTLDRASPVQSTASKATLPRRHEGVLSTSCMCGTDDEDNRDPWSCVCAALPAVPVSAALLTPLRDDNGEVVDFVIRAGNHIRSVEWLEAPGRQAGQRFMEARPGAAASGLLAALADVLATGRPMDGLVVDYTEERLGRLHRAQLLYYAASCGGELVATCRPVRSQAELLTVDAQHLASMGWGHWDLLSGKVTWSEGLSRIFRTELNMPWSLQELCDALLPADTTAFAEFITAVLAGEEPAWTRIRFLVLGEVRTLDLLGRPVAGTDGRPWAVHLVARDLTPQIRSRRRLVETERETERLRQQADAERRVADSLREALLPTHSQELAAVGLTVAAAYLASEPDSAVGGDWYKCRLLADGRVLVAMGDACGHGLDAVARMAQQRHALAGLAQTGAAAGEIMTWLNELVCSDPSGETATVIAGHIDKDRVLHWADAGHPAPLVRREGSAFALTAEQRGPLLGALPGYAYETSAYQLLRGDLLVLYTDGMVERRGEDITRGIERLASAVGAAAGLTPRQTIDRLVEEHFRAGHDDDACLLAIRVD